MHRKERRTAVTAIRAESPGTHMIVLPGGGYAEHAAHEAEPVGRWLTEIGVSASVFRYPLNVRHPAPLDALRAEIARRRAAGAQRIGLIGFSAGGHLAWLAALAPGALGQTVQFAVLGYAITSMETGPADPAGRGRQSAAAPVDLAGCAGHPGVAAVLRLAHRGGPLRPARAHLPPRRRAGSQRCSPRRARVRPRPARPGPGPGRRGSCDLDHAGQRLDP